jgi:hypothetical protein
VLWGRSGPFRKRALAFRMHFFSLALTRGPGGEAEMNTRLVLAPLAFASIIALSGCADTERSWAYPYRYRFEEPTMTPRMSETYRTPHECEDARMKHHFTESLDRCTPQPPITVYPIEWQTSFHFTSQEPNGPVLRNGGTVITQTWRDCRTMRRFVLRMMAEVRQDIEQKGGPVSRTDNSMTVESSEGRVTIRGSECRPIYIADRDEFTPLRMTEMGILARHSMADERARDAQSQTGR